MRHYFFRLNASPAQCERLYWGKQQAVLTSENGVRVSIPVAQLRRFITANGIHGRFQLVVDNNQKLVTFEAVLG